METRDLRAWGSQLRFSAPARIVEAFDAAMRDDLAPFLLFGSGDFHHLSALWARRAKAATVIVSFDNHPDWDVRPPKWCCGSWVNRALELPHIRLVSVWGCGSFETWWPRQVFGNRRAEREGRLEVHSWADNRPARERKRRGAILKTDWREHFSQFANVYVTIDLDCLQIGETVTNWESGRFAIDDLCWALAKLRRSGNSIVAGDICGAFSIPAYARWKQRFASEMDHPNLPAVDPTERERINRAALRQLWPALTDGNQSDTGAD